MAKNFAEIAFSPASKTIQAQMGSRGAYERMEKHSQFEGLTEREMKFIASRDSFYMATVGENDYPYIQHRGGPKGFLKVLDNQRIGCLDFKGNMQYVSVGNLMTNEKISLFLMDYPTKTRLKIYAKTELVDLNEDDGLYDFLSLKDYSARPERMMVFHIEAFDWNCPQHITARYTLPEIEEMAKKQREYISELEAEIKNLKLELKQKNAQ